MANVPLSESISGAASASGVVTLSLGPFRAFEKWHVTHISVASTSTVSEPEARTYRNAAVRSRLIDGTYTGTLDSTDVDITLNSGERIVGEWTGADSGSTATLTIEGEVIR